MKNAGPQLCFGLLPRSHDPQCRGLLISCKKTVGGGDEIEEEKDMEGEQKDFFIDFARRRRTRVQDFWRVFGEEGQLEAQQILLEVKCS